MPKGKILYTIFSDSCIIKMIGSIIYTMSLDFDAFIDNLSRNDDFHSMIIDMTETEYIDSTNLGLLIRLYDFSRLHFNKIPVIVSINPTVNDLLKNIGFEKLFTIINTDSSTGCELHELEAKVDQNPTLKEIMLDAHRMLMRLNETNVQRFKDVVKFLEEEEKP